MKKIARISLLKRANNSVDGNPRWRVYLNDGTMYHTKVDASVAFGLDNPEYKDCDVEVTIEQGQIVYVTPV